MNAFCPNCEQETEQRPVRRLAELDIRGETIPVEVEYQHCETCGEDFEVPRPDYDPLEAAYREYRRRQGMLQPEEIRAFRKTLGLTQGELSRLLGIGIATLNRYENGALQSAAHDQSIRLCMRPANLLRILEQKPDVVSGERRERLLRQLQSAGPDCGDLLEEAIEQFGSYPPSVLSGWVRFDAAKLFEAIKYFCFDAGVVKTKLMKLLYYADCKHFRDHGVSITGTRYAHALHGPVPDRFETWLAALSEWTQEIQAEEQDFGDCLGTVYTGRKPDLTLFGASELEALAFVKHTFQAYSARRIRDLSHEERGYQETRNGELISYEYALELQL